MFKTQIVVLMPFYNGKPGAIYHPFGRGDLGGVGTPGIVPRSTAVHPWPWDHGATLKAPDGAFRQDPARP